MKNNNNYEKGYFSIENKAIIDLKANLYRTYSYIMSKDYKGDGMFYGQETMARELKISVRTLQRHIKALKELGYILVKRRGFNMTNLYRCLKNVVTKVKEAKEKATENFKKSFTSFKPKESKLKFDNFTGRKYSKEQWDNLENKLLGWK